MLRAVLFASMLAIVSCSPSGLDPLQARAADDNVVLVSSEKKFCMIMPRLEHTDIGASEQPGGTKTYCSAEGHYSAQQGQLPGNFWRTVEFTKGTGKHGKRFVQLAGCIRTDQLSQLNAGDYGGQYDSSGGADGHGNPEGSVCLGYNHYVEIVEPASPRACIRCCDDSADCPTNKDTQGCPKVVPGNYAGCD
ncbi:hypothetical protein C8R43DRAFT_85778 [Mycena crocata]|nr:hypothetical protein C8R43DRAFT_85778 [Mycena crocata]